MSHETFCRKEVDNLLNGSAPLNKMAAIPIYLKMLKNLHLGPVVQSIVSLTSSLRVISLTVLADSMYNILIFFAEKM